MSVTVGDVVLGGVGSKHRHAVALVGPSVSVGARLLKHITPGGIIATGELVEAVRAEMPHLARDFRLLDPAFEVPATDGIVAATWAMEPDALQANVCVSEREPKAIGDGTCTSPNKGNALTHAAQPRASLDIKEQWRTPLEEFADRFLLQTDNFYRATEPNGRRLYRLEDGYRDEGDLGRI